MEIIHSINVRTGVGSVYKYGWGVMKKYFLQLFLLVIILGVISIPTGIVDDHHIHHLSIGYVVLKVFVLAYALFIINPIEYGAKYVTLKAVRHENFDVKEVFDVFKNYLNVVLAALLATSIIVIGFFFLIIPGIVFACRLAFVPYLVMDKKLDPIKAVEESWRLTKGHGWQIFAMGILAFFIVIGGLIVLIFGVIISIMWISTAFAAMYQAVLQEREEFEQYLQPQE